MMKRLLAILILFEEKKMPYVIGRAIAMSSGQHRLPLDRAGLHRYNFPNKEF